MARGSQAHFRNVILASTSSLWIVAAAPAVGQSSSAASQSAPPTVPQTAGSQAEPNTDIIVTARKREETELSVPGSVTAIRQEDLLARGATDLRAISAYVPGLNVGFGVGGNAVVIRGINTGLDAAPASGVIIDGAPIGSSSSFLLGGSAQFDLNPADIQRVEVLRGPQGTLYGASTLGGLVSYVTRRASLTQLGVDASGEVGSTRHGAATYIGRGAVDVPLINDTLGVRASGFYERDGGYIDNAVQARSNVNQVRQYGGRVDVHLAPSSKIDIDVWGAIQHTNRDAEDFIITDAAGKPRDGQLSYNEYIEPRRRQDYKIVHGQLDGDLGFARLTYIGTYQHQKQTVVANFTNGGLTGTLNFLGTVGLAPAFPMPAASSLTYLLDLKKNTQELRLSSNSGGRISWIVGGFYQHETANGTEDLDVSTATGAIVPTLNPAFQVGLKSTYEEYAGFGNVTLDITSKLSVSGGFRIGEDRQRYQQFAGGSSLPGLNIALTTIYGPAAAFQAATARAYSSDTVKTYLGDVKYQFSRNAQIYFRYATGFRPGGPNVQTVGTPPTFAPDTVDSYEVGFKGETADRKASLEIAGFYIDWSKIQVTGANSGINFFTNGGKALSQGVEASARVSPVQGLSFGAVLAYTDAHLRQDVAAVGGIKGDSLPFTPRWTVTTTADYTWPLFADFKGLVGGSIRLVSDRDTSFPGNAAQPNIRLDGYASGDVRVGVRNDRIEAALFVRNVTDTRAELAGRSVFGINEVVIARPRTIGVTGSVRY